MFAKFRICLLFSFLTFMAPQMAIAKEGYEHEKLSDLAFDIAIDYACDSQRKDINPSTFERIKCQKILDIRDEFKIQGNSYKTREKHNNNFTGITYGEINELVDYMHYPEQIFEQYNTAATYSSANIPQKFEQLNSHVVQLNKKFNAAFLDYLSASSHNERHFQDALLVSMNTLHVAAIDNAKNGYLYGALVRNSLSDHYLQDFFAPGHITTQRENSHDTVALAMHDWSNSAGTCFQVNTNHWGDLLSVLDFIEREAKSFIIDAKHNIDIDKVRKNLNQCGSGELNNDGLNDVLSNKKFQPHIINLIKSYHSQLYLQGDGDLQHNPLQQLFMILVQVRSIDEILQAYLNGHDVEPISTEIECNVTESSTFNTLALTTNYCWRGIFNSNKEYRRTRASRIVAPHAEIKYGKYALHIAKQESQDNYQYSESSLIQDKIDENSVWFVFDRPKYAYPTVADDAFLFSIGGQMPAGKGDGRFEMQLEWLPLAIGTSGIDSDSSWLAKWKKITIQRPSSSCNVFSFCNLGVAYGINYVDSDAFNATGGQIRLIKVLPKVSGQISVNYKRSHYRDNHINN